MATLMLINEQRERRVARFQRPHIHTARCREARTINVDPLDSMRGLAHSILAGMILWAAIIYFFVR